MPDIVVTLLDGSERKIRGESGLSIMEVIRDAGIDDLLALCGGSCSCATCHVHVDPAFAPLLPAMSEEENELLESAEQRDMSSRLSCQLPFMPSLDGIRVRIARQD